MARSQRVLLLALGVALAAVASFLLVLREEEPSDAGPWEDALESESAAGDGDVVREPLVPRAPVAAARPDATAAELASTTDPPATRPAAPDDVRSLLARSIEDTLSGAVDAASFLEAALELTELEIGRAVPEPHPSGAVRYRLLGAPEGVHPELWIRKTSNPAFDSAVLTLAVTLDPPAEGYAVAGVPRGAPELQITVWTDPGGELAHFGVHTDVRPDAGGGRPDGRVAEGLLYDFDAKNPHQVVGSMHGSVDRHPVELDDPIYLVGSAWPRAADLARLNARLRAMYDEL